MWNLIVRVLLILLFRTHSLKADTEEELEAWYAALRSKQVGA